MPSGKMLATLFLQYGYPWLYLAIAGIGLFVILGFVIDLRFFVVALIWLFFVIPLMVAFLYFYYGMDPLTAFNSIPHTITGDNQDIIVKILAPSISEDEKNTEINIQREYKVNRNEFKKVIAGPDYVICFFGKKGWLWLPADSFGNQANLENFIHSLTMKS